MFHFVALAGIYMLIASQRQGILLWINLGMTFLNIGGNMLLIPEYSFLGAAYVTLVTQILLMLITLIIVLRDISIPGIYWRQYLYSLLFA